MINWWSVLGGLIWVTGFAVCLAVLSMTSYEARTARVGIGRLLGAPAALKALAAGMGIVCLGLGLNAPALWLRIVLGVLAVLFSAQAVVICRHDGQSPGLRDEAEGGEPLP